MITAHGIHGMTRNLKKRLKLRALASFRGFRVFRGPLLLSCGERGRPPGKGPAARKKCPRNSRNDTEFQRAKLPLSFPPFREFVFSVGRISVLSILHPGNRPKHLRGQPPNEPPPRIPLLPAEPAPRLGRGVQDLGAASAEDGGLVFGKMIAQSTGIGRSRRPTPSACCPQTPTAPGCRPLSTRKI